MKQVLVYFGLFAGFVVTMSAVRYIDHYSLTYQQCAQEWQSTIKRAEDSPYLTEQFLEYLEQSNLIRDGKSCPKLLPDHSRYVRAALEKNL